MAASKNVIPLPPTPHPHRTRARTEMPEDRQSAYIEATDHLKFMLMRAHALYAGAREMLQAGRDDVPIIELLVLGEEVCEDAQRTLERLYETGKRQSA